ncbi:MAG: hypothetical protein NVS3B25_15050 [Hymenobacter sp.]
MPAESAIGAFKDLFRFYSFMKPIEIMVLGGCHVAGHAISPDQAFPKLLGELLDGEVVAQVPYLQFVHLPEHLEAVKALRPSHVVLQLGNHEFSASLRSMGRQLCRAVGVRPLVKKPIAGAALPLSSAAALPTSRLAYYARITGMSLLTAALWVFSARHRRSFRALNDCMREHPDTAFVFLSPFPCLIPADNTLRDFGGWLFRWLLADLPNRHWLDSHQVLRPDRQLFVDQSHLNEYAHRALAHGLATIVLSNVAYLF